MGRKITFIGAGSFGFTRKLVKDILSFPALADSTISLMDINEERLSYITKAVKRIVEAGKYPARVEATTDRRAALKGADSVVITILQGGVQVFRHDIEIPMKYGVDINIGDTRGPSGIFRALRSIPVMMDICKDIQEQAPGALVLNYTNPMVMLCRAVQSRTQLQYVGLCHSVQGTASMLADWLGASMDDVTYLCAGINHQAWYLSYKWRGKDAYPLLRERLEDQAVYNQEQVRNEMFLHLDYYVTESSGHNSEYNPWFRKRKDLIEKYCTTGTNWNPGEHAYIVKRYLDRETTWRDEIDEFNRSDVDLERGHEYAGYILNGVIGDGALFEFNGNVANHGLIDNLPDGCCVEVPVTASPAGLRPAHVGALPDHLAILNNVNVRAEDLTVEASFAGDPRAVFHAVCMDPLTGAVLSLAETKKMVDELFQVHKEWLPQFKHFS